MDRDRDAHEVRPFPRIRRAYVDVLREGHRRHIIHGLVEVDVTRARAAIRDHARDGRPPLSVTAFVIACVARAVDENRMLHAHRWGRRRLVLFDDVDVNVQLEQVQPDGTRIVQWAAVAAHDVAALRHQAVRWHDRGQRRGDVRVEPRLGIPITPSPLMVTVGASVPAPSWSTATSRTATT